jgi:outer membrane receptor protein involved in Fe transport
MIMAVRSIGGVWGPLAVAVAAAGLLATGGVRDAARAADADAAAGGANELAEITVTAQKRTEDIKDIPLSVSAIGGDELAGHHIADYDDITRTVPSVSFQAGAGPGLENIEIRGVSSTSGSATVGIYIDEVSITVKNDVDGAVQPKLFDLDRVEVLRGPQGTLYGASSMGGTIRFITKQPNLDDFSIEGSTDLSTTHHGGFNNDEYAVMNLPVVAGVFALRVGADVSYESGFIDHYVPEPTGAVPNGTVLLLNTNDSTGELGRAGVNDIRTEVFRVSGKYLGADDLTITPAFLWQRVEQEDSSIFYPSIGLYDQDKRVAEPGKDDLSVPSLTIVKNFGWADLTSVTSFFERDFNRVADGTYYNSNVFANDVVIPSVPQTPATTYQTETILGFLASPVYYKTTTSQFSQELRLSSNKQDIAGVPISWTAGLYFANQHQAHTDDEFIPGLQADFQQIYGYGIASSQSGVSIPGVSYANDLIYLGHQHESERQLAPFGELGIEITPQLKAAFGLRYVSAKTGFETTSGGYFAYGLPNPYSNTQKFSATTPKFSLDYAVDESTNLYASVAKGFRLGGPTGPDPVFQPNGPSGVPGPCDVDYENLGIKGAPLDYQSDSLWSYELGSKGRYFGNTLSVNAAVYAINWTGIQQTVNLPTCGFGFTTNAGDAKSYGTELEVRARATSTLTVGLNAGTTHAYITSTADPGIFTVGEDVLNVPKFTVTPSLDFDQPFAGNTLFARVDFPYTGQSHAYYNSSTVEYHYSPAYGLLNINVGFTHDRLTLGLYAKNALDNHKIIQYPSVNTVQEGFTVRPFTVGLTALFKL